MKKHFNKELVIAKEDNEDFVKILCSKHLKQISC